MYTIVKEENDIRTIKVNTKTLFFGVSRNVHLVKLPRATQTLLETEVGGGGNPTSTQIASESGKYRFFFTSHHPC